MSSAHVHLTYPFILSWSLLEAMSVGYVVIGSDTAPAREIIDDRNGMLVPFFDHEQLAERVIEALGNPRRLDPMRRAARQTMLDRYDLERICLPRLLDFVHKGQRSDTHAR